MDAHVTSNIFRNLLIVPCKHLTVAFLFTVLVYNSYTILRALFFFLGGGSDLKGNLRNRWRRWAKTLKGRRFDHKLISYVLAADGCKRDSNPLKVSYRFIDMCKDCIDKVY